MAAHAAAARYTYAGHFDLAAPKNEHGRFKKVQPPKQHHGNATKKEPDFLQYGHDAGTLCIECKNIREWAYPHYGGIKTLIIRAYELDVVPVLIVRRLHYTTRTNFLEPAGIIAHETHYQYYPSSEAAIADQVRHRNSLGFTDVRATEEPDARTVRFFADLLPKVTSYMAKRWCENRDYLLAYANDEINLAQLYNAIGSRAAGNWQEPQDLDETDPFG